MGIVEMVIAGLIVAAISGTSGWGISRVVTKRKIKALPKKWVDRIAVLIDEGISEGRERCVINAKAIVASRDAMRKSLVTLTDALNSEIDRLALLLGFAVENAERYPQSEREGIDVEAVWERLEVLKKYWGMKGPEIEDGIRKVLIELGVKDI